jgi:peptidoglycan L-alanyl-D-glutamate endopeptidase CwlK
MSQPINPAEILFLQRVCAVCGLYQGPLNGIWSDATEQAETRLHASAAALKAQFGGFDPRSETNIATLIPPAQAIARQFLAAAQAFPSKVRIISGTRTYAQQDALHAIGRTTERSRKPVTKARGGQSNHNFGIAWDVALFDASGRYMDGSQPADTMAYKNLATLTKPQVPTLEWGGDWTNFKDPPHYQLATGKSITQVRTAFEAGRRFF